MATYNPIGVCWFRKVCPTVTGGQFTRVANFTTSAACSRKILNLTLRRFCVINCCRGKAVSIKYCDCVSVATAMQHAKRLGRIILLSVGCPALPYFSTLCHKRHDFRGGYEHAMCVLILSTTFV